MDNQTPHKAALPTMALAALGVVFGDIGTSPLYTMKEVFSVGHHPLPLNAMNVYGILSLITWALILIVSIKYVAFIMRADNRGEGGIMALLALASRNAEGNSKKQRNIMLLGILGACMFYADGMITPAISVLSAVEGLEIAAPSLHSAIVQLPWLYYLCCFGRKVKAPPLSVLFLAPLCCFGLVLWACWVSLIFCMTLLF